MRHEARILNPYGITRPVRGDFEDGAQEGVGNIEVAVPVLGDRIGSLEAGSHDRHRVRLHVDPKQPAVARGTVPEIEDVQSLARLKQLAQ